jgi:dTDP-4-dehydrorhamnose 3,5-epimerase
VDIRRGSPTYGRWVSTVLSAENFAALWLPVGFAHGLCTLEPETHVLYKVTDFYSPEHERGVIWNDPELAITWPVSATKAMLSARDQQHPRLAGQPAYFDYAAPPAKGGAA